MAYGMLQELQVGDRNASLSMPGTHSRLKLTELRSQSPYTDLQALQILHHLVNSCKGLQVEDYKVT